ncbi:MAG: hypothetical protein ACPGU5_02325 [Lishizhenia sp.]
MLKTLLFLLFLTLSNSVFAQSKIDLRLLENEGEKIEEIYKFRSEYYNYLVYELNEGFDILDKKEVKLLENTIEISINNLINSKGEKLSMEAIEKTNFNFKSYGLDVDLNTPSLIKIDRNKFLLIKSKLQIAAEFSKLPLSHK